MVELLKRDRARKLKSFNEEINHPGSGVSHNLLPSREKFKLRLLWWPIKKTHHYQKDSLDKSTRWLSSVFLKSPPWPDGVELLRGEPRVSVISLYRCLIASPFDNT